MFPINRKALKSKKAVYIRFEHAGISVFRSGVYFDLSNKKAADASIITVNTCITRESHWGPI